MGKKAKLVTYTLKKERHYDQEPIPKRTRQIRAKMEQALHDNDLIQYVKLAFELIDMFVEVCDHGLVIQYCEEALRKLKHVKCKRSLNLEVQLKAHLFIIDFLFNESYFSLSSLCSAYRSLEAYDKALKVCDLYLKKSREANLQQDVLQAKFEYGLNYLSRGEDYDDRDDHTNALKYFQQSLNDLNQLQGLDKDSQVNSKFEIISNIGIVLMHLKEFQKSKEHLERALKIAIEQRDQDNMRKTYTNLALLYENMEEPAKCIEFTKKTLSQCDYKAQDSQLLHVLKDLGSRYYKFGLFRDALVAFKELENKSKLLGNDDEMTIYARDVIRELEALIEKAKEIPKYESKLIKARQTKNHSLEFKMLGERAQIYRDLCKWREAIQDYLAQLKILNKTQDNLGDLSQVYEGLASCRYELKEYGDAVQAFRMMFHHGQFDLDVKAGYLYIYAKALIGAGQNYEFIIKIYKEIKEIAMKLGDMNMEKECLIEEEALHRKWQYLDQAKVCRQRIKEIDFVLKEQEKLASRNDDDDREEEEFGSSPIDEEIENVAESPLPSKNMNQRDSVSNNSFWDPPKSYDIQHEEIAHKKQGELTKKRKHLVQSLDGEEDPIISTAKSFDLEIPQDTGLFSDDEFKNVTLDTMLNGTGLTINDSAKKKAFIIDDDEEDDDHVTSPIQIPRSNPINSISGPSVSLSNPSPSKDEKVTSKKKINKIKEDESDVNQLNTDPSNPRWGQKSSPTPTESTSNSSSTVNTLTESLPTKRINNSNNAAVTATSCVIKGALTPQNSLVMTPKHSRVSRNSNKNSSSINSNRTGSVEKENASFLLRKTYSPNSLQKTPTNRQNPYFSSSSVHDHSYQRRRFKVRLAVGVPGKDQELLAIPCPEGPRGTPKTVRWLIEEAQRRYHDIHKPKIQKLVTEDEETKDLETLCKDDPISDVLSSNQKVYAVLFEDSTSH